jgi:DNA-binding NarL/FixJ family response regulator
VREGIRSWLLAFEQIEVVGEAVNGKDAVEKAAECHPSVVVMDISMPVMNGLEATRHLRKSHPECKVLILTIHDSKEFSTQIIEAGALGYLSKNSAPTELVRAIEAVHRGDTHFAAHMTDAFLKEYVANSGRPKPVQEPELSMREREVLTLIADGFSNKEAAGLLGVSVRTIEKHRERIMDKLKLHSVVELTKYAIANDMVQLR